MCELFSKMDDIESYEGYKVVAEDKKGKRWSIAMEFCYDDYDEIPEVKEQRQIGTYFCNNILERCILSSFSPNMIGRTAVFKKVEDAKNLYRKITSSILYLNPRYEILREEKHIKFIAKIYKVRISKDLMIGKYIDEEVVAGRKIEFLGELDYV